MSTDHHDDPFEDRLGTALRQTGDTFDTDRPALIAAGRSRGRTLRLRRRAAVAGGAAGIALVGLAGALVLPGGGGPSHEQDSVSSTGDTAPPSGAATPRSPGAERMVEELKRLLPEGKVSDVEAGGGGGGELPYVRLVHDDSAGGGLISLSLSRVEPGSPQAAEAVACPDKVYVPHDSCTTTRQPDGSVLMLFQGYEYPDRREDTKLWRAELVTADGVHVGVSEWNAEKEKGAPVTRPEPPLAPAKLGEIATASVWAALAPAEDRPGSPPPMHPSDTARTFTGSAVNTLVALLPEKAEVVSKGGEGEFGFVVVDDGRGQSLLQVNVQPGMGDTVGDLFGGAEILPDGTLVTERQGPGEKGGEGVVMWTADTLREDGLRVVISAFNSGTQHSPATRETPALTTRQLREIALDPRWPGLLK